MRRAAAAAMVALIAVPAAWAGESFDPAAYDKKAFEWTGYLELLPERQWLRRDSAGQRLA